MSSSKTSALAHGARSLRARTILAFLTTAAVVSALSLFALYALLRHAELRRIDRNAEFYVHERAAEYLIGGNYSGPKHAIHPSRLPGAAVAKFLADYPDARIEEAFSDDGRAFWFCAALPDGSAIVAECGEAPETLQAETIRPADRLATIREAFAEEYHGEGYGDLFHLLLATNGTVMASSPMSGRLLGQMVATGLAQSDISGLAHLDFDGEMWAADTEPFFDGSIYVLFHRIDRTVTRAFLATGALTLLLLLAAGTLAAWRLASSVTHGIDRVVQASRRARDGDYAARIGHLPDEGEEIDRLVDSVNEMLARTQGAIRDLKELSDGMAHDLKTPLTRLIARAELAFYDKSAVLTAEDVAEDCRAMLDMVNAMLDLSRAINGPRPGPNDSADLADVVRSSATLFSSLAEDKGVSLAAEAPGHPLPVRARLVHLQRIAANLIDNAIKFTPEGGKVTIAARKAGNSAILEVSDTGCGIPAADMPRLFKRFWRSDASRAIPGNGLGLAIVKAFAESCGGSVSVESNEGRGTVFAVTLNCAPGV
ncbi:MAG: HAMP domain-containing histidine kinase [Kiritimatiellae bacterium]|nr:HAMP domain-containing histidine kinase [Kiritimatiellia bacterium]